ncbi:sodium channel protein type 4 subunit alpha B-like, partial [Plectropomus leopardus]|uniref:sodium channel protein type 4 subunit alpha B-like n=1 Tax=Plectropomus leopardus TaxID=160734 RepID=UPI001C4AA6A4
MRSRGTGLFEWWRSQQETGDLLRRTNQLRLPPAHLTQLLGDSGVRAALQGTKMASLLPPVGTEVFRRLTPASLERMRQEAEEAESQVKKKKNKKAAKSDRPEPACDLEAGKPLPFFYGAPPPELLNTPLEELDPFYQSQKTFVVLGKGNVLYRFSAESSCYLLTPFNLLRSAAIRVLLHSLFSLFMTATILTNCAFMMLSEPPAWSRSAEHVFTAIYTLEVIIKVTSQGLCLGHFTFLRDPWNWLDVLVILTGLRPFLESGLNDVIFLRVPWNWLNFLIISK